MSDEEESKCSAASELRRRGAGGSHKADGNTAVSSPAPRELVVSQAACLDQLSSMFPHLTTDDILAQLNRCGQAQAVMNRDLDRTILALLAVMDSMERGTAPPSSSRVIDEDERLAQQLQAELNGRPVARSMNFHGGGISEEELTRLKLEQFNHRDAIYKTNAEGEFGKKGTKREAALPQASRTPRSAQTPMARIASEHAAFVSPSGLSNRVASTEEIEAAKQGPKAVKALRAKQAKDAAAAAHMQSLGWVRPAPVTGGPSASALYGHLAGNDAAHLAAAHASDAGVPAAHSNMRGHAVAAPHAYEPDTSHLYGSGSSAIGSSSAVAPGSARKEHHHRRSSDDHTTPEKERSKKKKKKDDKDKDREKDREKKKKKSSKDRHSAEGAASSSSAAAVSESAGLLDMLPEYSRTASVSQIDEESIEPLMREEGR